MRPDGKAITPYEGSWADTLHTTPLARPPVPAVMANQERLRVFKLETPGWALMGPDELARAWALHVRYWNDGVTRLPTRE